MTANGVITLTTDFGLQDMFVGVMKGVMLGIAPNAQLVDLTHDLPNQNIASADFIISRSFPYFPDGTTHMVVVDPGVGTSRRMLVAYCHKQYFVAPDNGVLSSVLRPCTSPEVHEITNKAYYTPSPTGNTFDGRDVFSPVAAHLSAGLEMSELGPNVTDPIVLPESAPILRDTEISGQIVYIDKFGNAMTNITRELLDSTLGMDRLIISTVGQAPRFVTSYADGKVGVELIALINSWGLVELSINQANASDEMGLSIGNNVSVSVQ